MSNITSDTNNIGEWCTETVRKLGYVTSPRVSVRTSNLTKNPMKKSKHRVAAGAKLRSSITKLWVTKLDELTDRVVDTEQKNTNNLDATKLKFDFILSLGRYSTTFDETPMMMQDKETNVEDDDERQLAICESPHVPDEDEHKFIIPETCVIKKKVEKKKCTKPENLLKCVRCNMLFHRKSLHDSHVIWCKRHYRKKY